LRECLREGDTLSRIGGDEFMLLLPHIRSRENAAYIAQKIIAALKKPFNIEGNELYAGMSIGIAIFPDDGDNIETLIKHADIAMYHAKDHGRNDYKFFTQDLHKSFTGRLAIENEMRHALEKKEFEVFYQPQVAVESQRIRGMEALIRWNHPSRGLVSPNDFHSDRRRVRLDHPDQRVGDVRGLPSGAPLARLGVAGDHHGDQPVRAPDRTSAVRRKVHALPAKAHAGWSMASRSRSPRAL
jgi:predicted signal transduction protein with EAL and GGDEF domain